MLCDHELKKVYAVINTSAHHFESTLGTVGEPSPTAALVTPVAASRAARSSEFKCVVPDSEGLAGKNEALSICFAQCWAGTTRFIVLKTREMGGSDISPFRHKIEG